MAYGLYISAAGAQAQSARLNTISSNIANATNYHPAPLRLHSEILQQCNSTHVANHELMLDESEAAPLLSLKATLQ